MSRVPGQHNRDWPHVPTAPTQPAESVPAVPRRPPKLNPEKCQHIQKKVRYLGRIVSPDGITTDLETLEAVREWPSPKSEHDVRRFLGLCTYYRQFIFRFSNLAKALVKLTEDKQAFQ
jgi:hypothetical protein